MPRDAKVDLWLDEHGIERPFQHLRNVGFIGGRSAERGPTVGVYLQYQVTPADPLLELRFHLPVETARQVAEQLQSYADLAENHTSDPKPTRPN